MKKEKVFYLALIIILIYSFFTRLNFWGNSFRFPDSYRDYLVSRNIVRENKLNLIGPYNGAFGSFSSPVYFYTVAAILKINQSMLFLEFILILLQVASIYLVFLIGKNLFSLEAGVIAATFYSFMRAVLQQANFIWQPNLMQPIFIFSLYFLLKSYTSKSFKYLIFSVTLASLSIILYNTALGSIFPLVIVYYILFRKNKWHLIHLYLVFLTVIIIFLVSYMPPVIYYLERHQSIFTVTTSNVDLSGFLNRFPQNLKYLIHLNSYHISGTHEKGLTYQDSLSNILSFVIIILSIFYLTDKKNDINNKKKFLLLILFIISPVILASISRSFIQARHFFICLVPLSLLLGEVIGRKLKNTPILLMGKLLLISLLLKGFMLHPSDFNLLPKVNEPQGNLSEQMFRQLQEDIIKAKNDYHLADFHFFQFNIFPNTPEINGWSDAEIWTRLEDSFNIKFTKNDDSSLYLAYRTINNNQFVYLICDKRIIGNMLSSECINNFLQSSGYLRVRKVAEDSFMSIYLTQRP